MSGWQGPAVLKRRRTRGSLAERSWRDKRAGRTPHRGALDVCEVAARPLSWSVAAMRGLEIVGDQAYFTGSTAELQRLLAAGELDRCGSLVVEGKLNAVPPEI